MREIGGVSHEGIHDSWINGKHEKELLYWNCQAVIHTAFVVNTCDSFGKYLLKIKKEMKISLYSLQAYKSLEWETTPSKAWHKVEISYIDPILPCALSFTKFVQIPRNCNLQVLQDNFLSNDFRPTLSHSIPSLTVILHLHIGAFGGRRKTRPYYLKRHFMLSSICTARSF